MKNQNRAVRFNLLKLKPKILTIIIFDRLAIVSKDYKR